MQCFNCKKELEQDEYDHPEPNNIYYECYDCGLKYEINKFGDNISFVYKVQNESGEQVEWKLKDNKVISCFYTDIDNHKMHELSIDTGWEYYEIN